MGRRWVRRVAGGIIKNMDEIQKLKNEIEELKKRNQRVDADKAWETSGARKILIVVLTNIVIVLFF